MTLKQKVLAAAMATAIPAGQSGLWYVKKCVLRKPILVTHEGKIKTVPPGNYTKLFRWTDSTLHLNEGECVMHDTPEELQTHLDFMLRAKGRVLITGLGLGCVVRGCLANPAVERVTVVELSADVLKLVWPHMPQDPRLIVVRDDARKFVKRRNTEFDVAWHDLWTDRDAGEPHLALWHMEMMCDLAGKVQMQGAWAFPRYFRRISKHDAFKMI